MIAMKKIAAAFLSLVLIMGVPAVPAEASAKSVNWYKCDQAVNQMNGKANKFVCIDLVTDANSRWGKWYVYSGKKRPNQSGDVFFQKEGNPFWNAWKGRAWVYSSADWFVPRGNTQYTSIVSNQTADMHIPGILWTSDGRDMSVNHIIVDVKDQHDILETYAKADGYMLVIITR